MQHHLDMVHEFLCLLAEFLLAYSFSDDGCQAASHHSWVLVWRGGRDKCNSIVVQVISCWDHGEEGVASYGPQPVY